MKTPKYFTKVRLGIIILFAVNLLQIAGAATVSTDRADYTPHMTVVITGAGWQPGERVDLTLAEEPDVCPTPHAWSVTADTEGNFTFAAFQTDLIHIGVTFTVYAVGASSGSTAQAQFSDASANLDQTRNGLPGAPVSPMAWVNGNVNSSQAHFVEGYSIPYRMVITDLTPGSHSLVIEWDITVGGARHAIDYITHYDRILPHNQFGAHSTPETIVPTNGINGVLTGPTTFPIPAPSSAGSPVPGQPTTSFNALPAGERVFSIWNGTITSAVYVAEGNLAAAGEESSMEILFVTTNATVIISWGGHIATKNDWGADGSASGISGSPYHMRLISMDGGGGNQDRSLQAGSVVSPPTCPITGPSPVCPGTTNMYMVTTDIGTNFIWSLTNNNSGSFITGPTNGTSVKVVAGSNGSYTVHILVSSNSLSSVCTQIVQIATNTTSTPLADQFGCQPTNFTFSTTPSGTGPFTFVWRKNGAVIAGATNNSITLTNLMAADSGTICVEVTGLCTSVTNCATLTVGSPPTITCPSNVVVQCYADVPPPDTNTVTASAGVNVSHEGDIAMTNGCQITITRNYKGVNACGMSTCSQTITVVDTTPPAITCQSNRTVECGAAWAFDPPAATDNCDGTNITVRIVGTMTNALCGNTFSATRTWEAIDGCTNRSTCSQTITVVDTTPPVITCASNRTVECGAAWVFDPPAATDACDGTNVTVRIVGTMTNALCGNTFSATRTWEAIDGCTNRSTCSQTITVVDTTPPVITCQSNRTVECGAAWAFDPPAATDACDGTNVTVRIVGTMTNGLCGNTFSATRTWEAIDGCTNRSTCSQTITVVDTTPPVITCQSNRTVECGAAWAFDPPAATDACEGTNVTVRIVGTMTNGLCGNTFSATRTWEAIDGCTNRSTCSQTITVVDTTPPTVTCQSNRTVECGAAWAFDPPAATDACEGTNVTVRIVGTMTNALCGNTFSATRTWEAIDGCTNRSTCSQTITVVDTTPPVITCQPNRTNEWVTGAVPVFGDPTATDSCDTNVTITFVDDQLPATCPAVRIFRRTWTATDDCTNQASCAQLVVFVDTTPPVITCQPNRTNEWVTGAVAVFGNPEASDTCDTNVIITFADDQLPAICPAVRIFRRTWTATDDCTNQASCAQLVVFVDTTPPVITCQPNRTNEWVTGAVPVFGDPSATDSCDTNVTITFVDDQLPAICPAVRIFRRTWTATDDCTNSASCSQTITFIDTTPPVITCQPNRTNEWVTGAVAVFGDPTATDTCDTNVTITFVDDQLPAICPAVRIFRRTWTATDDCTNSASCSQTITFIDTTPPVITCQPNRTNEWVTGAVAVFGDPTATDSCDTNVTITFVDDQLPASCPAVRIFRRTWTATDDCTNSASCAQLVVFVDTTPPVITCQPNRTNEWVTGAVAVFGDPTATDTCDTNVTITFVDDQLPATCPAVRIFRRTWTATDDCTNSASCAQLVVFIDTTPPVITCQPNRTNEWVTGAVAVFGDPTATDSCDTNVTITFVDDQLPASCPAVRIFRRTWTATDDCTNSASCSQTITFIDTTPPVITCQPNRTNEWVTGAVAVFGDPTATDSCDTNVTITFVDDQLPAICPAVRIFRRTWTATDDCTNSASCSQTITFIDTTPPVITCQPNRTNEWVTGAVAVFGDPTATDSCDTNVTITFVDDQLPAICPAVRIFRRTWTATDDCTNSASCSQTITFIDTTPPVITCQPNRTNEWVTAAVPVFGNPEASDTCDTNVTITFVDDQLLATCPAVRIFRRTWTATDDCTNQASCAQLVVFIDTTPPVITCQPNRTNEWVTGAVPVFGNPEASDTCDTNVTITFVDDQLPATCPAVRIFRRTWTATDDCTNQASCAQLIVFLDTTPPVITCQPNRTNEWVTGAVPVFGNPEASDTCDTNVTITFVDDQLPAICPAVRIFRRTWTATDDCTNSASCAQLVVFIDTTPPVITCQPNRTNEWVTGAVAVFGDPTATDSCDTNVTITFVDDQLPATCPAVRIFRRTWTATDDCTNRASCAQLVVFVDTTPPVITCQPNRTNEWVTGAVPVFGNPEASDTCDTNVTITFVDDQLPAICPAVHIFRRTWTATDDCTNRASCAQLIVFVDTTPPVITCQPNRTNEWVTGAVAVFGDPTASDSCDTNVTITFVDDQLPAICPAVRIFRRTWTATDDCTNSASCSQTITFIDTTPPVITCQPNRTNEWVTGAVPVFGSPEATDTCDTNVIITFVDDQLPAICPTVRIFRRTWTATDDCTNRASCAQLIVFVDTTPPVITCQPNRTNEWVTGAVAAFGDPTASDNCDTNVTITFVDDQLPAICPAVRIFRRTWTATDDCTNSASCAQLVVFVDTTPPVITCQPNRTNEWVTGAVPVFGNPEASDTCDTNVTITFVDDQLPAICPTVRIFRRTWTATDDCTNRASCAQLIVFVDTTPPVITCQPNRTNEWVTGAVAAFGDPTATDTCDTNVTITFVDDQLPAICPAVRIFRRTWTATDDCTNSASCSQTITFIDTTPPVITCQPNRTNEWVTGAVAVFGDPTATDTCDTNVTITFVDDQLPAICPAVRIFRRTWTATDDCTNSASCSQTITFIDTTPPVITCQPNRTNEWVTGAVPVFGSPEASDTCDTNVTITFVDDQLPAICPTVRIFRRTWTATDDCTNRASCAQLIVFVDTTPPVITCQPNRTNEWVTGAVAAFGDPTASDNCDTNVTITFVDDQLPAICPAVRIFRRTWTATDDCTNSASCAQLVVFVDTTPPVITCQPNRTNEWVTGAVPVFGNPEASDTCDTNVTITFVDDQLPAICPTVRIFRRTWTATDDCTNRASCAQLIVFVDTTPPVITCQPNRTNEWVTGAVPVFGNPEASDTCDTNVTITFVDDQLPAICPAVRIFRRTWTATDDCTNSASCAQLVVFVDTTPPVITCQPNRTNEWVTGEVAVFGNPEASDTCDTNVTITFVDDQLPAICPAVRIFRRTWTATDDCTNRASCAQLIVFVDTTPPVITCQPNRTNEWVTGAVAVFGDPTASDSCDTNVTITFVDDQLPAICPAVRIFRRTWTATDDCTNSASCAQLVVFVDTTPPVITCQPNRTNEWVTGAVPVFGNPEATDTCDTNVTITFVDDQLPAICPAVRIFRRTWTATDDCTNRATCSQTITFIDTTPPVITCQPNRTNEWVTGAVAVFGDPTATDTCDTNVTITFVDDQLPAICPAVRIFRRTWTATDDCTNSASCAQLVVFVDTTPPAITCQPNRTNEWVTGAVPVFGNPEASDTCDTNVTITFVDDQLPAICPAVRIFRRTWTATDDCTNRASCAQLIVFVDTTPPVITCQPNRTNEWVTGAVAVFGDPTATDTCDTNVTITFVDDQLPAICPAVRIFRRTWTATDDCTNRASCAQLVVFIDTTPPVITCQPNRTNEWVTGAVPVFGDPTATDTCDTNVTITFVDDQLPAICPAVRIFRRTWTATDDCTNRATCAQLVVFIDTTPPVITCQPNRTNEWVTGAVPVFGDPTATDSCDTNVTITFVDDQLPAICPTVRIFRRTWTATDDCTNRASCAQLIVFADTTPPVITCQPNRTNEWVTGAVAAFGDPTASDSCDTNVTITFVDDQLPAICPAVRIFRRTWTATDDCTNRASCAQLVVFVDTTPPVITCEPNRTNEWVTGAVPVFGNPEASDTCDTNVTITFVDDQLPATCPAVRIFRRIWTATDDCTNRASCAQLVVFVDTTPPVITCQPNRTNEWVIGAVPVFGNPEASDTCDTNVTITFVDDQLAAICPAVRIFRRTWTATDDCTNRASCAQLIVFLDTTPPVMTCQPNRTNEWVTGAVAAFGDPTATDTFDTNMTITFVDDQLPAICPAVRILRRTWTATGDCTNRASCAQIVVFVDTTPPVITCQPNRTNEWVTGAVPVFGDPTATDSCDTNLTITFVDDQLPASCPAVRIFRRTWTATDDCTNSATCSQTITFVDTTPPVITCQANRTNEWVTGAVAVFGDPTATDTCDTNVTITFVDDQLPATCPAVRILRRTWTATDDCTNRASCAQSVVFVDTTPPVLVGVPTNQNYQCRGDVPPPPPVTATDNCDTNVTLTLVSTTNGSCPTVIRRTWTATDDCTNRASATQTITVDDTIPPTITCASSKTVECAQNWTFDPPTATDNCGSVTIMVVSTVTNAGPDNTFIAVRTWKATDTCSNMAVCSQAVTIQSCPMFGGCRVTGGSNHETNNYQGPCITSVLPSHISHGGQVGAPFSVGTPFTPNSPCISGEWQHNRHTGKGNKLVGTFHASGNGHEHQFDSLLCACLPCPEDPNAVGTVGALCNPGDRTCGPEPRRAPANKICFSGVGDYTFTNGKKTVKAVFRVDIEDRSEGNSHASSLPPDRYRIRLWILDPSCGRNPDPNSAEAMALRLAASADPATIGTLATTEQLKVNVPPDIDDGGNLTQGNHQIHPSTGSQCTASTPPAVQRIDAAAAVANLTPAGLGTYGITAQGYQTTTDPAFVYRVTITNSGTSTLTNLAVAESTGLILEDMTQQYFEPSSTLPPNGTVTRYSTNVLAADTVLTVVVAGQSQANGAVVRASSTAVVTVTPAEPHLSIRIDESNLILEWPASTPPDFLLESTPSLNSPVSWNVISNATNPFVLPNTPANGARYYRLRAP